ncbi:hypothetical protein [Haladaptatus sp. NG-SE-30]
MSRLTRTVRFGTALSTVLLLVVVVAVGLVAFVAETQANWQWYFRMEQTITAATPIAMGLLTASLVGLASLVVLAGRE